MLYLGKGVTTMRLHCPHCHTFLAVGSIFPKTAFRCHACEKSITPPVPNASYFACSNCGLTRPLDAKYIGKLVKCSECRTINRVDSLHLLNRPPAIEVPQPMQVAATSHFSKGSERRESQRFILHDLSAYLGLLIGNVDVYDISATGASFNIATPERDFTVGELLHSDLYYHSEIALEKVPLIVMRHNVKTIGCRFDLTDKKLERNIQELIDQAVMRERYLKDNITLDFEEDTTKLQMREHNYF